MIITRTPVRLSLFGGGSDYNAYVRQFGGVTVGLALSYHHLLTVRRLPGFFAWRWRVATSGIDRVVAQSEITNRAVRGVLSYLHWPESDGLEVVHQSDIPDRCGVGSSSAFVVGLLHALHALRGEYRTPDRLRREATEVEQVVLGECVGGQDQAFAAHGGLLRLDFHPDGAVTPCPIPLRAEQVRDLERHLLLVYTGVQRVASEVAGATAHAPPEKIHPVKALAEEGYAALRAADWKAVGQLVDRGWRAKTAVAPAVISTSDHGKLYTAVHAAGAWGVKGLGAGGGGMMCVVASPDRMPTIQDRVRDTFPHAVFIPVGISLVGSHVVYAA